jgi:hypothetical protein
MSALAQNEYALPAAERRARIAATVAWLRSRPARDRAWLVDFAINRRAGWVEGTHCRSIAPPNHRGAIPRKATSQHYMAAWRLSRQVNYPRLVVRRGQLGEARIYEARLRHRLTYPGDESW